MTRILWIIPVVLLAFLAFIFILSRQEEANKPSSRSESSFAITEQYQIKKVANIEQPVQLLPSPSGYQGNVVLSAGGALFLLKEGQVKPLIDFNAPGKFNNRRFRALSLAFHKNWPKDNRVYLYSAATSSEGQAVIWQYRLDKNFSLDLKGTKRVITIPFFRPGHDGGMLATDDQDNLWLATGDGGCCGDPKRQAQNPQLLIAKMLRIRPKENGGYTIPKDNPFVRAKGVRPEIVAFGLRNPWRWSFEGQDVWIADVGENAWEEINVISKKELLRGANFGWSKHEGLSKKNANLSLTLGRYIKPIFAYPHREPQENDICYSTLWGEEKPVGSISGGTIVQKPASAKGLYVFADFCFGAVFLLQRDSGQAEELLETVPYPVSVNRGSEGETYIVSAMKNPSNFTGGGIYQLTER